MGEFFGILCEEILTLGCQITSFETDFTLEYCKILWDLKVKQDILDMESNACFQEIVENIIIDTQCIFFFVSEADKHGDRSMTKGRI